MESTMTTKSTTGTSNKTSNKEETALEWLQRVQLYKKRQLQNPIHFPHLHNNNTNNNVQTTQQTNDSSSNNNDMNDIIRVMNTNQLNEKQTIRIY